MCISFSRRIHCLRLILVRAYRLSLLQNVPMLEAPHPQARTWKLSRNTSPRLMLLQRRREVVIEPSDGYMQIANLLIDIGPTPSYEEWIAYETAGLPMGEMSSIADPMSPGVDSGRPFFVRTSCIWLLLSNAAAKTSPKFPVVRAAAIVLRRRT